ncbi:hypothetical protein CEUSTIGMA_g4199.t1 [Chlamydomonas eustigma]|uniref:J domain-containing protein n=1 Tax=Chlamydomonas eustigma TaxID=1157962 RepID=A0A250X1I7_9CHLO|nr:hypothetical protein CEUSTIGMA_g4199.t1 [Chlamydomonas eustigma]|eukprot:GAX76752.1 hypothetical protein CEUSTIGMA_g4199.t1 [Chlamydomonas eustigma]
MRGRSSHVSALVIIFFLSYLVLGIKDPYRSLGLTKSASDDEIKRAYRKLAVKYHPDKNPKGKEKFVEIQEAYELLADPQKKRQYDLGGGDLSALSATATASSSPWLILVWSELVLECRTSSQAWEAVWKVMSSGGIGQEWVKMGRVHYRSQQHLVHWINQGVGGWRPISHDTLPVVLGVPSLCTSFSCMVRYHGDLSINKVQEFVAESLLKLAPIPSLSLNAYDILLANASPLKVVALAFGRSEGQGSLALRMLSKKRGDMVHFVRVTYKEAEVEQWQEKLQLQSSLPAPPFVVILRGPGSKPEVLVVSKGASSDLEKEMESKGLIWQALPALRPATAGPLGCLNGDASGSPLADLCVVAVSTGLDRQRQEAGRYNAWRLQQLLWEFGNAGSRNSKVDLKAVAKAMEAGKLRVVWLDASTQPEFCRYHRPAQDDELFPCGIPWWQFALNRVLRRPVRHLPMRLMAFKPLDLRKKRDMQWIRRPPPALLYQHATLPSLDLSQPDLTDSQLWEAAAWIAACHASSSLTGKGAIKVDLQGGMNNPPPLSEDDVPGLFDSGTEKVTQLFRWVRRSAGELAGSGFGEEAVQALSSVVILLVLALLHFVWYQTAHPGMPPQQRSSNNRAPSAAGGGSGPPS